ncbi:D-alanyl-D-alanine carboxypeptidase [Aureibaculum sp. 2210JD6-5]|uniref:D-alanyl-D-alanine carboxypeptidase/D-alanyl-D-alanine-endopeptidase n=1 Tax=Aureibaculum sp. 2210JD6-5 TaxID=3103957 RepID=UPI002AADF940|nr:D-alanyl-D-alanine carboxypeptidase [Aureibaculum sp. 2210JD6-5]MDY7394228.1 D-alanyl-D-alanine carboxypeptidase [Aureibaculum sp. 2210JD6-5]
MKNKLYIKLIKVLIITTLITSCGTTHQLKNNFKKHNESSNFFKGFVLYNPATQKQIVNHNGAKFFTPASNTKIYTFYAAYRTFKDSVKSLAYYKSQDSLVIKGTADPSLLYAFESNKVLNFLKNSKDSLYMIDATIEGPAFGAGWAWGDYPYYYQPERSLFPIYGNMLTYKWDLGEIKSYPTLLKNKIKPLDSTRMRRDLRENNFYIAKNSQRTYEVPFITSNQLTADLLSDTIGKKIKLVPLKPNHHFNYIYSQRYDSLYKQMLTISDNFIAEQLMLQVGKEVSGKYSSDEGIKYAIENYLQDLPHEVRWADGSGLSRYNQFTPENTVKLLEKMYREIPREKLLDYFPVGGKSGTIKNWYANNGTPFVWAKTGTLNGVHCLSGYLITKKGTFLIFSYMNNHYSGSSSKVKKEMEVALMKIYNSY